MPQVFQIELHLNAQEWLRYYSGQANSIFCRSTCGTTISIPAMHFRPFTTNTGVHGVFRLTVEKSKIVSLERW